MNFVLEECKKFNLNLIYYTTVRPFDYKILDKIRNKTKKIIIVEPFYCGSITNEVLSYYKKDNLKIESISIPYKFLDKYGLKKEHDENLGFSIKNFQKKIVTMLKF